MNSPRCKRILLVVGLVAWCFACGHEPPSSRVVDAPTTAEGVALAMWLEGAWMAQHTQSGACPEGVGASPFQGEADWSREVDLVTIEPRSLSLDALTLQARDGGRLQRDLLTEVRGCVFAGTVLVEVEQSGDSEMTGNYVATYAHDGGEACLSLAQSLGWPDSCRVESSWAAVRIP